MLHWRNSYYQNFYGPILRFLVTFYSVYKVKCDQKVEYRTILCSIVRIFPLEHSKILNSTLSTICEPYALRCCSLLICPLAQELVPSRHSYSNTDVVSRIFRIEEGFLVLENTLYDSYTLYPG